MSAPQVLLDAVRCSHAVFVKTENFVPAHLNKNPEDKDLGVLWGEERLRQYFAGECDLNYRSPDLDVRLGRKSFSIFVGDSAHHSWIMHFHVRVVLAPEGDRYEWSRVL